LKAAKGFCSHTPIVIGITRYGMIFFAIDPEAKMSICMVGGGSNQQPAIAKL
jgi:hypothetical protein